MSRLTGRSVIGFDVTEFLDHALTRSPITLYLFHLVRQLLDGRRLVCWMDEFWRLLADPAFESFAKDGPKTWRKLNGVMCLATQSPSDVLDSPISRTLVEQTPTKVFFPNADANLQEYTQGFGLTEREFKLIKDQLEPGSRMFLVKQAHHSVVCQLDLKGFDAELAVISGRAARSSECTGSCRQRDRIRRLGYLNSWPRAAADVLHSFTQRQETSCLFAIFDCDFVCAGSVDGNRSSCPGAMGGHRCAGHRAAGAGSADHAAAIGDRPQRAAIGAADAAGHDGQPRHGGTARRHQPQLPALPIGRR